MTISEFLIIFILAILLVKPRDIPKILRIWKKTFTKLSNIKADLANIINLISHNQEILELEKLIKSKSELKDSDIELIYRLINENIKENTNLIDNFNDSKNNTLH